MTRAKIPKSQRPRGLGSVDSNLHFIFDLIGDFGFWDFGLFSCSSQNSLISKFHNIHLENIVARTGNSIEYIF